MLLACYGECRLFPTTITVHCPICGCLNPIVTWQMADRGTDGLALSSKFVVSVSLALSS